ncbi:hypothetical protein U1Q18_027763, partial [Sarracenia purpurea var. burkii]
SPNSSFIDHFRPIGCLNVLPSQLQRCFAFCTSILVGYLLIRADGGASFFLLDVADQMRLEKDMMPMVLAETLIGLDNIHQGIFMTFAGSSILI